MSVSAQDLSAFAPFSCLPTRDYSTQEVYNGIYEVSLIIDHEQFRN